jgi:hypothetical protein
MKALCTELLVCLAVVKVFPQYLLCNEIPLQYHSDSISFGKTDIAGRGDSVLTIPIYNLNDTTYYDVEAKLIPVTPLPGGTSIINEMEWQPFSNVLEPGQTAVARFYFKVDSLIPPEFKTSFRLWIADPVKPVFDSCVFADFVTVNLNFQIVPKVFSENADAGIRIYPIPAADVLHLSFMPEKGLSPVVRVMDISGQKVFEQEVTATNWDMDVSSLVQGVYLLTINQNGVMKSLKFMVIR